MKLQDAINQLASVAPARASTPALTHIWLGNVDGQLVGRASNGDFDLVVGIEAELDLPEPRLLPVEGFRRFISGLSDPELEYDTEHSTLAVRSGSIQASFHTASGDEFPTERSPGGNAVYIQLEARTLHEAFDVRYAASGEDYRAIFRGVQVELYQSGFRTVASDGFRLAVYDSPDRAGEQRRVAVVPRKALDLMAKLLPSDETPLKVAFDGGNVYVQWEGGRIAAALMEGKFPDYERVVPAEFFGTYRVRRDEMVAALKRLAPLADRQTARVDLEFGASAVRLTVEGDYGRAQDVVQIEGAPPDADLKAFYNLHYLLEALHHLKADADGTAVMKLTGPATPTVVEGTNSWAIVVPLRV